MKIKTILKELKQLTPGGKLELIADNTESMKALIRRFTNCKIVDIKDENGTTRIKLQKMKLDALIMAGGKGSRLGIDAEKPLLLFDNKTLIERVIEALKSKYIKDITVVTSRSTGKTEAKMREKGVNVVRAPGRGYVNDMLYALEKMKLGKTLVISSDLPLVTSADIDYIIKEYLKRGRPAMSVFVPERVFKEHGIKPTMVIGALVPAGINIVDGNNIEGEEAKLISEKVEFAVNVNTMNEIGGNICR
ncbi:MAG: NTP transferase domain-containing protein [Candidatus Hydrothermarchaeaceae archaeon]